MNFSVDCIYTDEVYDDNASLISNWTCAEAQNPTRTTNVIVNKPNIPVILVYTILFVIAGIGNLTVFICLFKSRHRKSRISLMIRHLAVADLIVTFVMIPIEVGWRITGRWIAGNMACKIVQFLRALGPYLSSNVLICVSLDRYFAVMYPLRVNVARKRGKMMLTIAWGTSLVYCIPQCFVFRLKTHPQDPNYKQCVTFGYFSSETMELAYNLSCIMFLYFIPLVVIVVAYTCIMVEISRNSKLHHDNSCIKSNGRLRLRRSDTSTIQRARIKTLRMTITIVLIYLICCTPYVIMTLWYMFDRKSAQNLPKWLQDLFFLMVVSNSCMNPMVYGSYVVNFKKMACCTFCLRICRKHDEYGEADAEYTKDRHHFTRIIIKTFFGKKVNSVTKTTVMHPLQQPSPYLEKNNTEIREVHQMRTFSIRNNLFSYLEKRRPPSPPVNENSVSFHSEPPVAPPFHSKEVLQRRNSYSPPLTPASTKFKSRPCSNLQIGGGAFACRNRYSRGGTCHHRRNLFWNLANKKDHCSSRESIESTTPSTSTSRSSSTPREPKIIVVYSKDDLIDLECVQMLTSGEMCYKKFQRNVKVGNI